MRRFKGRLMDRVETIGYFYFAPCRLQETSEPLKGSSIDQQEYP